MDVPYLDVRIRDGRRRLLDAVSLEGSRVNSRHLARNALFTALVAVATMVIRIPNPATQGYINLGDTMIFTVALVFGGRSGAIAGGLGSGLADGLGGYFLWAPWTVIIKGLEGFLVGALASRVSKKYRGGGLRLLETFILTFGGTWMVFGYYIAGALLLGPAAAVLEIPGNLFQATVGLIVALPVSSILRRTLRRERVWN